MDQVEQAKHTPGPWSFIPDDAMAVGEGGLVRGPQDQWIADVTSVDDRITPDEAKANARLIAAAPEFYEVLVEALNLIGGWRELIAEIDDMPKNEALGKAMWAALDQIDKWKAEANTAIAKATGAQS